MLKLTLSVIVEAIVGIGVAAAVLAVVIPWMMRRQLIRPGDTAGAVVIGVVLLLGLGVMVFRPGSALHRRGKTQR
jgi:hypothetical protein